MRVSHNLVSLSCLLLTQAYAGSSTLSRLEIGSSSNCRSSGIDIGGLGELCSRSNALPYLFAAPISVSWLSMVAMKDQILLCRRRRP